MDPRLDGKVAIVTGADSGIGKALATRLARDGAAVVVADLRNQDTAAAEIAKATGCITYRARARSSPSRGPWRARSGRTASQ